MCLKKIKLKYIGYLLLITTILINLYFGPYYGVFSPYYDPISANELYINTQTELTSDSDYAIYIQGLENTTQILTNEYWLICFVQVMLDAIAIALSFALIVHPTNKKK